ncbi:MAG: Ig-like domain-containing protein [Gemmatimonadota bacterium]
MIDLMRKQLLFLCALALAACDGADPFQGGDDPSLTLSPESVQVTVGATRQVTAVVTNSSAAAEFVSRDTAVARVSANGTITGVRTGRTFVVSTLSGKPAVRDSVPVAVVVAAAAQLPVLGTGTVSERYTAEVAVAEPFAYTTTWNVRAAPGNAVKIWNVTGNTPVLIDSLIVPNAATLGDVQISDDGSLLVVAIEFGNDDGIAIYDRSTPAKPTLIRRFTSAAARQGVHTVKLSRIDGRHYAFLSLDPRIMGGESQPARLSIVDITDPANPTEVFVRVMGQPFIHDVFVRDGVLFAALWHTGMTIFDVGGAGRGGTPSAPVELGTVKTASCNACGMGTSSVHNIWWFHDPRTGSKRYAFIGEEGPSNLGGFQRASGDVHVVDVRDFSAPREVAFYSPDSTTTATGFRAGAHNFVMDEPSGILYAAFYNGGVRALDVRGDLSVCGPQQKSADGRCDLRLMGREVGVALSSGQPRFVWGVALQGNNLYASDMPNGLHKISVASLRR